MFMIQTNDCPITLALKIDCRQLATVPPAEPFAPPFDECAKMKGQAGLIQFFENFKSGRIVAATYKLHVALLRSPA